jgi:hypothetical protein
MNNKPWLGRCRACVQPRRSQPGKSREPYAMIRMEMRVLATGQKASPTRWDDSHAGHMVATARAQLQGGRQLVRVPAVVEERGANRGEGVSLVDATANRYPGLRPKRPAWC